MNSPKWKKFFFKTAKINEFRLWGLILTLGGMGLMILGTAGILLWGSSGKVITYFFMFLGMLSMAASVVVYFWAGVLSTSAVVLVCPICEKQTKMLGKTDRCMYCRTILTFDPAYAPKEESSGKAKDEGDGSKENENSSIEDEKGKK